METKFNFKSAICTSREQSEKLLALGLKKETADCYYWQECDQYGDPNGKWHLDILNDDTREHFEYLLNLFGICLHLEDALFIPAWSLHRLIEMMPNNIHKYNDIADLSVSNELVQYRFYDVDYNHDVCLEHFNDGTLYNNIIDSIEWLIKEGYFNKEYLEEMETIGMPKEIEELKGFEVKDNKRLGNEHTYWNWPIKRGGIV